MQRNWLTALLMTLAMLLASTAPATQTVYVDFDSILDAVAAGSAPGSPGIPPADELYDYSPLQRSEILGYLNTRYAVHDVVFVAGLPAIAGTASVVQLNKGGGGSSDGVDFRNLDDSDSAEVNTIAAFKFLGKDPGTDPWTDDDVMLATANLVGHEAGHLMGVRHQDAFGPIGSGIGTFPTDYAPPYPAPAGGPLTFESLSYLTTGFGLSFTGLTTPSYVSERAAIKMHLATPGADDFVVAETLDDNHGVGTAQPLDLIFFDNPYPYRDIPDIATLPPEALPITVPVGLMGRMRVVEASLSELDGPGGKFVPDYFSFTATAGAPVTIEAMSAILEGGDRYADPTDLAIILLDGTTGAVLDYKPGPPFTPAANDDDFATAERGASIIDAILPPVFDTSPETGLGTYVIEVLSADEDLFFIAPGMGKTGMDGGSYELLVYQAAPIFITVPEPTAMAMALVGVTMLLALRRGRYDRRET